MHGDDVKIYLTKERYRGGYRWRVTIREPGRDGARSSKTFSNEAEARRHREDLQQEIIDNRELTVGDVIDDWLEDLGRRCADESVRVQRTLVEGLCDREAYASDVTPETALQWYRGYQKGRSAATHQQGLQVVKAMWRFAIEEKLTKRNPWRRVQPEGRRESQKKQLRIDEARKFADAALADAHPGAVASLIALLLGLRTGQIRLIKGRDVDDNARVLWVHHLKRRRATKPTPVRVPEMLQDRLRALAATVGPEDLLFPHGESWLAYHVDRLCRIAEVPEVCPHGLRGTFSSLAVEMGATAQFVQEALQHSSAATSREHYVRPESAANAGSGRVWRVLEGGKP